MKAHFWTTLQNDLGTSIEDHMKNVLSSNDGWYFKKVRNFCEIRNASLYIGDFFMVAAILNQLKNNEKFANIRQENVTINMTIEPRKNLSVIPRMVHSLIPLILKEL